VGVPQFHIKDGHIHAIGKAFGIQWFRNKKLLIAPLHLLGPEGGYPVYIEAQDVPDQVLSVDVLDLKQEGIVATAGRGLLSKGLPVEKAQGDLSGDMMAFELTSNSRLPLLPLAPSLVPVGTKVWVLTKNQPATTLEADRFPGTVIRSFPSGVTIQMDGTLTALASSGSPVVNAKNELVCMMVGKRDLQRTVVMGIPSTVIYARLYKELGR
jgi:hypothetical protein